MPSRARHPSLCREPPPGMLDMMTDRYHDTRLGMRPSWACPCVMKNPVPINTTLSRTRRRAANERFIGPELLAESGHDAVPACGPAFCCVRPLPHHATLWGTWDRQVSHESLNIWPAGTHAVLLDQDGTQTIWSTYKSGKAEGRAARSSCSSTSRRLRRPSGDQHRRSVQCMERHHWHRGRPCMR